MFTRILVPTDFSPPSDVALVPPSPETRTAYLQQALERLSHRVTPDDRAGLHAKTEVIFGKPAQAIANYASDNGFDLIVMGTPGRSGIAHLLIGSVAELVVRHASCPVMTIHEGQMHAEVRARLARRLTVVA